MDPNVRRPRRARHLILAAVFALLAMLLPATAGVALGHHAAVVVIQIDCNGNVNYDVTDWSTSGSGALATFTVSYAVNGGSTYTTLGTGAFTSANGWHFAGSFGVGPSVTSVIVRASNFVWGDGASNPGPYDSGSKTRPPTCSSPTIATTLSKSRGAIGSAVHDSATLTGATSNAGGTVKYSVYTNNTCTAGAQDAGTKTVTNHVVPDSNSITFNGVGTWYWQAVYSGDAANAGAISVCTEETLVIDPSPSISAAPTETPFESFQGETATPRRITTPPPTSSGGDGSSSNSTPLIALLICFALGGLSLAAVEAQRRSIRS